MRMRSFLILVLSILCMVSWGGAESSVPTDYSVSSDAIKFHGLNFGPYLNGKDPENGDTISENTIRSLLTVIKPHTTWIRTFGTDKGLEKIPKIARSMRLKTMMGAWISKDRAGNEIQLKNLITAAKSGYVDIAAIGNEVNHNEVSDDLLVSYITRFKKQVPGVKVTCVDKDGEMLTRPKIVKAVDVVSVNIYPFWSGTSISAALKETQERYNKVKKIAAGKEVIITEMGWPSAGNAYGSAKPSLKNAYQYLRESTSWADQAKIPYFYFEAFDEAWKAKYSTVESHFGVWNGNKKIKYTIPSITAIAPKFGSSGKNTKVTITGTNFGSGSGVSMIKGTTIRKATLLSHSTRTIVCMLPTKNATSGLWNIRITNTDGIWTIKAGAFTVKKGTPADDLDTGAVSGIDSPSPVPAPSFVVPSPGSTLPGGVVIPVRGNGNPPVCQKVDDIQSITSLF